MSGHSSSGPRLRTEPERRTMFFLKPDCCFSWLKTCYFFQNGPAVEVYSRNVQCDINTTGVCLSLFFFIHLWLSLLIHKGRQRGYKSWLHIEIHFFPFLTFNCIEISTGGGGRPAFPQLKWPRRTSGITLLSTRLIFLTQLPHKKGQAGFTMSELI